MTVATKCDQCGGYSDGPPAVTLTAELETGASAPGSIFDLFTFDGDGVNIDFCSVECLFDYPVDELRDELVGELDDKEVVLELSSPEKDEDVECGENQERTT